MVSASQNSHLTGVVLAGGLSSRLGSDKADLRLGAGAHGMEETLLTRTALLLRTVGLPILVAGREHPDFPWISDDAPGNGPLGGIVTALRYSKGPCLILSCDLPFMDAPTLRRLIAAWKERPPQTLCTAFFQPDTGQTEHLAAIYEYRILNLLEQGLQQKCLKIARILPKEHLCRVFYGLEDALPFFNINYPADLLLVRRYIGALPAYLSAPSGFS